MDREIDEEVGKCSDRWRENVCGQGTVSHRDMQWIYCFLKVKEREKKRKAERMEDRIRGRERVCETTFTSPERHNTFSYQAHCENPPFHNSIKRETAAKETQRFYLTPHRREDAQKMENVTELQSQKIAFAENRFTLDNQPDKAKMAVMLYHSVGKKRILGTMMHRGREKWISESF